MISALAKLLQSQADVAQSAASYCMIQLNCTVCVLIGNAGMTVATAGNI